MLMSTVRILLLLTAAARAAAQSKNPSDPFSSAGGTVAWSQLRFAECDAGAALKWTVDGDRRGRVQDTATGRCLSVLDCNVPFASNGPWATYGVVVLDVCGAGPCSGSNQDWTFTPPTPGEPQSLEATELPDGKGNGWCLNSPLNPAEVDGQEIIMYRACDAANSKVTLKRDGTLVAAGGVAAGKCLTSLPCSSSSTPPCALPSSWGSAFLLLLFLCSTVYVGGGIWLGGRNGVTGTPGLAAHPHAAAWKELAGLVADGVHWARGGGNGSQAQSLLNDKGAATTSRKDKQSKKRSADRTATAKKVGDSRASTHSGADDDIEGAGANQTETAPLNLANTAPALAAQRGTTAAGDGGRWVRVKH